MDYPLHPAAELFPKMSDKEIDELAADIKANGLHERITLWRDNSGLKDGTVKTVDDCPVYLLDGRNRIEALRRLGLNLENAPEGALDKSRSGNRVTLEAFHKTYGITTGRRSRNVDAWETGVDPWAFVISANIRRRHLTTKQKQELVEKLLREKPERSDRQTAALAKISDKTVGKIRAHLEANEEIPHKERIEASGRKARGRKPHAVAAAMTGAAITQPPALKYSKITKDAPKQERLEAIFNYLEYLGLTLDDVLSHFADTATAVAPAAA